MSTLKEIQKLYHLAIQRKTVLLHVIEYLDSTFRGSAGMPPDRLLLTDDRIAVPESAFESIAADLTKMASETDAEIEKILGSTVVEAPPSVPTVPVVLNPVVAPSEAPTVELAPAPKKAKSAKN